MTSFPDLVAVPDLSVLLDQACVCTATACGAGAVGGDQGDIWTRISSAQVASSFTPNGTTGWTCFVPAAIRNSGGPLGCYCAVACGGGGTGGDPGYIDLGKTQSDVNSLYGGGLPGNQTGWLCGIFRGEWNM